MTRMVCSLAVAIALQLPAGAADQGAGAAKDARKAPKSDDPPTLAIGARAPDFELRGIDGKLHRLRDFEKSPILVVIFTCNHCPTAQAYEGRIKRLFNDYRPKGVAVVAISPNNPEALRLDELGYTDLDDTLEAMKIRADDEFFYFPYLYDGDRQEVSRAYGPKTTPHVFVFDAARVLRYTGRFDSSEDERRVKTHETRDAIDALLAGKPVPVETTRPFGCSVKWAAKREAVEEYRKRLAAEKVELAKIDPAGLAALRANKTDRTLLLNIWATWCGPCVAEFPSLVTVNRMYRNRPFEFVAVSVDLPDRSAEVLPFLTKQQASNRNYLFDSDDRDALAKALNVPWGGAIPLTILIKPGGEVAYVREGMVSPLELRRAILKVLGRRM